MEPNEFLKELSELFDKAGASKDVLQAALNGAGTGTGTGNGTADPPAISAKHLRMKGGDMDGVDPKLKALIDDNAISKAFWLACGSDKDMVRKGFGSEAALQDPRAFLRRKDANGQYVVKRAELEKLININLAAGSGGFMREGAGTPVAEWSGNQGLAIQQAFSKGFQPYAKAGIGELSRASKDLVAGTNTAGGYLIRTDLEPLLYEVYLRAFPFAEALPSEPANGLVHTYNVRTAPPTASTVSEVGDFSGLFSTSTLAQRSSAIAVIIAPVGVGLKLQYAVGQSGMSFDVTGPDNLEVTGALIGIAKKNQALLLQGNQSTGSKTLDDEEGLTDANGYDGYRTLIKGASYSITKSSSESYVKVINRAVAQLMNKGADVSELMIVLSVAAETDVNSEFLQYLSVFNQFQPGGLDTAGSRYGLITVGGWQSKMVPVPADAQGNGHGYYTYSAATVEDIDIIDPNSSSQVYLGSPTPTILELPIGYNNKLSNVYIPFLMNGLALKVPEFCRKIRIPKITV
jgi:hypothetical protein